MGQRCPEMEIWWSGEVCEWKDHKKNKNPLRTDPGAPTESSGKHKSNSGISPSKRQKGSLLSPHVGQALMPFPKTGKSTLGMGSGTALTAQIWGQVPAAPPAPPGAGDTWAATVVSTGTSLWSREFLEHAPDFNTPDFSTGFDRTFPCAQELCETEPLHGMEQNPRANWACSEPGIRISGDESSLQRTLQQCDAALQWFPKKWLEGFPHSSRVYNHLCHRVCDTHIFPVSAFLQPYTSPNPPLPIILCTLKSFMVSCKWIQKQQNKTFIFPALKTLIVKTSKWSMNVLRSSTVIQQHLLCWKRSPLLLIFPCTWKHYSVK